MWQYSNIVNEGPQHGRSPLQVRTDPRPSPQGRAFRAAATRPSCIRRNVWYACKLVDSLRQHWGIDGRRPVVRIKIAVPLGLIPTHHFAIGPYI